jgi:peptidoglycan/xylan/chitin deacetylase (PgdA/CDA1 family)
VAVAAITFDHLGTPEQMAALCDVVERHGVKSTFFVTGERAAEDPQAVRTLHDAGHEIGMHGWAHEQWSELDRATERELAARATQAIADAIGEQPRGFRAPGGARSAATAEILADQGYVYDASLGDGMRTSRLSPAIASVPFVWPGVDGYWYLRDEPADPETVEAAWRKALDKDGLFVTICHPEITGIDRDRLRVLDTIVATTAATRETATVGAIAARIPA